MIRRAAVAAAAAVIGLAAGALGAFAFDRSPERVTPVAAPAPSPVATSAPVTAAPTDPATPTSTAPVPAPATGAILVWAWGGMPAGFEPAVRAVGVTGAVTIVRGGLVDLVSSSGADGAPVDAPPAGLTIPLDTIAIDPATFPAFVPVSLQPLFIDLGPGEAVLGETSARLRHLGPGGTLRLAGGAVFTVAGVVPDTVVGAAELVVALDAAAAIGVTTERYALLLDPRDRDEVETLVRAALPAEVRVRVRGPGETPYLRAGDAVLPQSLIKDRFGEFAYRRGPPGVDDVEQDPGWQTDNVVAADVPILGRIRCHRGLVTALAGAFAQLEQDGLAALVDPAGYQGCWNPRFTRSGSGLSRHVWGAAVDLNVGTNPTDVASAQDPRLVAVMERWGFTWGGNWLVPDPAHFEYVQPAAPP